MSAHFKLILLVVVTTFAGYLACDSLRKSLRNYPTVVSDVFFESNEIELFSLSPNYFKDRSPYSFFHGYEILGSVKISDRSQLAKMAYALDRAVDTVDLINARCFWPRHGVRAVVDGRTIEFLICFQCHRIIVYEDNEFIFKTDLDATPKALFDKPLSAAGIQINAAVECN